MNIARQLLAAAVLITVAGAASAEQPYPPEKPFVSTKTRAEVVAEINQAGRNLGRKNYEDTFSFATAASGTTRAQVIAELRQDGGNASRENYINSYAH